MSEAYEALGRNFANRGQADSATKYYQALLLIILNAIAQRDAVAAGAHARQPLIFETVANDWRIRRGRHALTRTNT